MQKTNNQNSWYSAIVAILMVGFLLVLTTGIFNLVLREMYDNRGRENYIKAYYGAEAAQELALLAIKEKWYAYYDAISHDINDESIVLAEDPVDKSNFHKAKDVFVSYDLNYKVESYSGSIDALWYDIIPLFYLTDAAEEKVNDIALQVTWWTADDLVWNIVSNSSGVSGIGSINSTTKGKEKTLTAGNFNLDNEEVSDFLQRATNTNNYLILFNAGGANISYNLTSGNSGEFFTTPRTDIISSGQIGDYRQNIRTHVDNTAYLNILRYSIYSR